MSDPTQLSDSPGAIGARLKLLCKSMGVSQTVIAERLGVSLSTWHGYEKGRRSPNSEHARRISKTFGVPTDWIWFGHEAFLPLHLHEKLQAAASLPDKHIRRRA